MKSLIFSYSTDSALLDIHSFIRLMIILRAYLIRL